MKKWFIIIGSITMLVVFITIMSSGFILKRSFTESDDVIKQINLVEASINKQDWEQADNQLEKGFNAWEKVKNRIQFSVERDFLEKIDNELATLKGAIKAKDEKILIISIEKIKKIWNQLGR